MIAFVNVNGREPVYFSQYDKNKVKLLILSILQETLHLSQKLSRKIIPKSNQKRAIQIYIRWKEFHNSVFVLYVSVLLVSDWI